MGTNESTTDRAIRAVVGIVLVIAAFAVDSGALKVILGILALIALVTAAVGFCPLYKLLGMSTSDNSSSTDAAKTE